MSRRRSYIPQKRPVFIGCEGESECGYVSLLQDIIRDANLPIHLMIEDLGLGAGDPLAKIQMAIRKLDHLRRTRTAPVDRFIIVDSDRVECDSERKQQAQRLARDHNMHIIWQEPCFEAVLLRHMLGRSTNRPPTTLEAKRALKREWPQYEKPMNRTNLSTKINLEAILRAAKVEPGLYHMLICFGLIPANANQFTI